jgi:hypothetical protein
VNPVRQQNLTDLFTTACEGGIQYWATVEHYRRSDGDFAANRARIVDHVARDEDGQPEEACRHLLTAELIGVALRRVAALPAETFALTPGWKQHLTKLHFAAGKPYFDDLDYDATDADVIAQVAVLNRHIYG